MVKYLSNKQKCLSCGRKTKILESCNLCYSCNKERIESQKQAKYHHLKGQESPSSKVKEQTPIEDQLYQISMDGFSLRVKPLKKYGKYTGKQLIKKYNGILLNPYKFSKFS